MEFKQIISDLKVRKDRLEKAIATIITLGGSGSIPSPFERIRKAGAAISFPFGAQTPKPKRKKMSKAARAKIAAAQKARWAKVKASRDLKKASRENKKRRLKKAKRKMSAAAKAKISAAAKARWAKAKAAGKKSL